MIKRIRQNRFIVLALAIFISIFFVISAPHRLHFIRDEWGKLCPVYSVVTHLSQDLCVMVLFSTTFSQLPLRYFLYSFPYFETFLGTDNIRAPPLS